MMESDPRLHFVVATAIIVRDGKYLIVRRAPHEKAKNYDLIEGIWDEIRQVDELLKANQV